METTTIACLSLFKIAPKEANKLSVSVYNVHDCLKNGFIVFQGDTIVNSLSGNLFNAIKHICGNNILENNQTLHKNYRTIDQVSYYTDQLLHYFSTYGLESMGIKGVVYVPYEELDIPEFCGKITVIRLVGEEELAETVNDFLQTVERPSLSQVAHITQLMNYATIDTSDIASFELQVVRHEKDGTVPKDPVTFLRYIVYRTTGSTMLIKNRSMIDSIINNPQNKSHEWFAAADLVSLSSIFLRYKPIFLAFKRHPGCAPAINKLRRLAIKYHRPLIGDGIKDVTNLLRQDEFQKAFDIAADTKPRDLVKIINSVSVMGEDTRVYTIRNGKAWVSDSTPYSLPLVRTCFVRMLADKVKSNFEGKKFYIPSYIDYAVPTSEKQFTGNIPWGSVITVPSDEAFTVGVHWFNTEERVDLDLHMQSETRHFGWNSDYAGRNEDVIFTGDQTAGPKPHGAAEAYWFNPNKTDEKFILTVNKFSGTTKAPFKFFMASEKPDVRHKWYVYDGNHAFFTPIPLSFDGEREITLGLFDKNNFYFYGGRIGDGIVPRGNYPDFIKGLAKQLKMSLSMKDLIKRAGGILVDELDDDVIDLSPEALTSTTLLDLVH